MSKHWLYSFCLACLLALGFNSILPELALAKAKKSHPATKKAHQKARKGNGKASKGKTIVSSSSVNSDVEGAKTATLTLVKSLEAAPLMTAATSPAIKNNEDEEDRETAQYVESKLNALEVNENAGWIFETSLHSIKTVFNFDQLSNEANIVQTLKQTACIFIAETHYGNLPDKGYDQCDQTNIGQIRPPAYQEIYEHCYENFKGTSLSWLGKGTNCGTLHPYEMPLCCEATNGDEPKYNCEKYENDPYYCISKRKRQFLEDMNAMTSTRSYSTIDLDEGLAEPITCKSTSGDTYIRIPAIPTHSIFASIFYLKLIGYKPMSHEQFAQFGATRYNAADAGERYKYQRKLNTCLNILDKQENSEIIQRAYLRATAPKR